MLLFQKKHDCMVLLYFSKKWTPNEMDVTCGSKNLPNDHPFPIFLPLRFREPMSTHFHHDFLTMLTYKNRINLRCAIALIHEFLPPRFLVICFNLFLGMGGHVDDNIREVHWIESGEIKRLCHTCAELIKASYWNRSKEMNLIESLGSVQGTTHQTRT